MRYDLPYHIHGHKQRTSHVRKPISIIRSGHSPASTGKCVRSCREVRPHEEMCGHISFGCRRPRTLAFNHLARNCANVSAFSDLALQSPSSPSKRQGTLAAAFQLDAIFKLYAHAQITTWTTWTMHCLVPRLPLRGDELN